MIPGHPRSLFRVQRSVQTCPGLAASSGGSQASRLVRIAAAGAPELEVVADADDPNHAGFQAPWGSSAVLCADHSCDGRWFAVGSKTHSLYAYETSPEQPPGSLPRLDSPSFELSWHQRTVITAAFHPSRPGVIASGGFDSWVGVWDLVGQSGEGQLCEPPEQGCDGRGPARSFRLLDRPRFQLTRELARAVISLQWQPDLDFGDPEAALLVATQNKCCLWKFRQGRCDTLLDAGTPAFRGARLAGPRGCLLVVAATSNWHGAGAAPAWYARPPTNGSCCEILVFRTADLTPGAALATPVLRIPRAFVPTSRSLDVSLAHGTLACVVRRPAPFRTAQRDDEDRRVPAEAPEYAGSRADLGRDPADEGLPSEPPLPPSSPATPTTPTTPRPAPPSARPRSPISPPGAAEEILPSLPLSGPDAVDSAPPLAESPQPYASGTPPPPFDSPPFLGRSPAGLEQSPRRQRSNVPNRGFCPDDRAEPMDVAVGEDSWSSGHLPIPLAFEGRDGLPLSSLASHADDADHFRPDPDHLRTTGPTGSYPSEEARATPAADPAWFCVFDLSGLQNGEAAAARVAPPSPPSLPPSPEGSEDGFRGRLLACQQLPLDPTSAEVMVLADVSRGLGPSQRPVSLAVCTTRTYLALPAAWCFLALEGPRLPEPSPSAAAAPPQPPAKRRKLAAFGVPCEPGRGGVLQPLLNSTLATCRTPSIVSVNSIGYIPQPGGPGGSIRLSVVHARQRLSQVVVRLRGGNGAEPISAAPAAADDDLVLQDDADEAFRARLASRAWRRAGQRSDSQA